MRVDVNSPTGYWQVGSHVRRCTCAAISAMRDTVGLRGAGSVPASTRRAIAIHMTVRQPSNGTSRLISSSVMGKAGPRRSKVVLAAITVLVIGLAMRAPIISVSPILVQLQEFYGLGSAAAGLLTILPVLCFGALALLAPRLDKRFGIERTMSAMLLVLIIGMLIRAVAGVGGLFTGTIVLGAAV